MKRACRRGELLVQVLVGIIIGVLSLTVVWRAYASVSRQDAATRLLADRLQTYTLVRMTLQRDLDGRCAGSVPALDASGRSLLLPPCAMPEGPADGPRGSAPIRWTFDATRRTFQRQDRDVGLAVVDRAAFAIATAPGVATVRVDVTWSAAAAGAGAASARSRIAHSWPLPVSDQ
jgi:hypothetical protein